MRFHADAEQWSDGLGDGSNVRMVPGRHAELSNDSKIVASIATNLTLFGSEFEHSSAPMSTVTTNRSYT